MFVYYNHRFAKLFGTGVLFALLTAATVSVLTAGTVWIAATNSTSLAVLMLAFVTVPGLVLMGLVLRMLFHMIQSWPTQETRRVRNQGHANVLPPGAHHVAS